ncbi:MAG: hypothetical protein QXQ37_07305 [Nitrososphaerota archaeon]
MLAISMFCVLIFVAFILIGQFGITGFIVSIILFMRYLNACATSSRKTKRKSILSVLGKKRYTPYEEKPKKERVRKCKQ